MLAFTGVAALITGLITAALVLVVPIVGAAVFGGGATWAFGNHERGKTAVIAGLVGGFIMLTALQIATAVGGLPHG